MQRKISILFLLSLASAFAMASEQRLFMGSAQSGLLRMGVDPFEGDDSGDEGEVYEGEPIAIIGGLQRMGATPDLNDTFDPNEEDGSDGRDDVVAAGVSATGRSEGGEGFYRDPVNVATHSDEATGSTFRVVTYVDSNPVHHSRSEAEIERQYLILQQKQETSKQALKVLVDEEVARERRIAGEDWAIAANARRLADEK